MMNRVIPIGLTVLLLAAPAFAAPVTPNQIQASESEGEIRAPRVAPLFAEVNDERRIAEVNDEKIRAELNDDKHFPPFAEVNDNRDKV